MTLVGPSLLERADRLARLGAEHASAAEEEGRLATTVVEAIGSSGLPGLNLPAALGGFASPPVATAEVLERIAVGDAATAWVVMVASTASFTSAFVPRAAAARIWQEGPATITAGVLAPKGAARPAEGGYQVSGWWPFASGILHASWVSGGVLVEEDGKRLLRTAFFPVDSVQVLDTWHVMGLAGTGSHDFRVDDVFVPAEMVTSLDPATRWCDEPLFRFPVYGLLAAGVAAVCLGIARGAIDDLVVLATEKTPTGSVRSLAQRASTQEEVARAEAHLAAARAFLHVTCEELWEGATEGMTFTARDRARLRIAATHATEAAAEVVGSMYRLGGGTALYQTSPLQRRLRDVNAATQHMMVARPTWEVAGRVLLGVGDEHAQL